MKKLQLSLLLFLLIVVNGNLQAQDYLITFAVLDNSGSPDSVLVENQNQLTELTLNGNDVLHLVENTTGISNDASTINPLRVFPNPVKSSGTLEFYNSQNGNVQIGVYNSMGALLTQYTKNSSPGYYSYRIEGLNSGTYIISVTTRASKRSVVLISNMESQTEPLISLRNKTQNAPEANEKSANVNNESVIEMQYDDGDNLKFTAFLNDLTSIEELIPTSSQTISFNFSAPVAAFTADQTDITEGETINFTDQSTNAPTSWSWNFGDGSFSTEASPSHTYSDVGTYTVELTVSNEYGSDIETKSGYITVESGGGGTIVVDVTNPTTGQVWMDRNLGASQVAVSSTDAAAYGDVYQWGRGADGHQLRTSGTTTTLSNSDTPGHGDFITNYSTPWDWRMPQNDNLWQGVNGINNPCPEGYRLPTEAELDTERQSWNSNDATGAFASPLKFTVGGVRNFGSGTFYFVDQYGRYWTSTVNEHNARSMVFTDGDAYLLSNGRADGSSVRCIKD